MTLVLGNLALVANVSPAAASSNPAGTINQCANGGVAGPYTPCVGSNISAVALVSGGTSYKAWQNGNLNGNQAHWAEGEFISYRAILSNLSAGPHTVVIRWDPTDNGKHAIDYLGSYDATETTSPSPSGLHANNNNPCADLVQAGQLSSNYCTPPSPSASAPVDLKTVDFGANSTMCGLTPGNDYPQSPKQGQIDFFGPVESASFSYGQQNVGGATGKCYSYATITFTLTSAVSSNQAVVMAWGGHVASSLDWGSGNAAGNISGSPYHMAIMQIDTTTIGNQDRSLSASAIIAPTTLATQVYAANGGAPLTSATVTTGAAVYDTAQLSGSGSALPPTGSVTYSLYKGSCETGSLIASSVVGLTTTGAVLDSPTSPPLGAGSYYYLASYSGDANYSPSTASCEPFTVSKAQASVSTTPYLEGGNPVVGSSATVPAVVYDTAEVSGVQGFVPSGSVTFTLYDNAGVGTNGACTGTAEQTTSVATLSNGAAQSASFNIASSGNYGFSVQYGGDSNYMQSQGSCEVFSFGTSPTVATTTIYDASTSPPLATSTTKVGTSVYDTATVTAGGSSVTAGSVTFDFFANGACTGTAVSSSGALASGVATSATTGALAAGTYSFLAVYNGNSTYGASTATCEVLQVEKAPLTLVTTVLSADQPVAGPLALGSSTADSVSSLTGATSIAPTGTATYQLFSTGDCTGGSIQDTVTLSGGTIPDSSVSAPLGAGSYSYQLTYNGDNNYASSSAPCESFSVSKATPEVTTTVLDSNGSAVSASLSLGSQVSDSAQFSNLVSGIAPTGPFTYQLFDSGNCTGTALSTENLNLSGSSGLVSDSLPSAPLGAGNHSYLATYGGGANYTSATAGCEPFSVSTAQATLSTTIYDAASNGPVQNDTVLQGATVYDTATLGGTVAGIVPTGQVSYEFFANSDCSGTSASYGTFSANTDGTLPKSTATSALAVGSYSFRATYLGDRNYVVDNSSVPCEPLTVAVLHPAPTLSIGKTVSQSKVQLAGTTGYVEDSYALTPVVDSGWVNAGVPVTVTDSLPTYGGYVYGYQVANSTTFAGSCEISTGNTGPVLTCNYTPSADVQTPSLGTVTLDFLIKNDAPSGTFDNQAGIQYGEGSQVHSPVVSVQVSSSAPAPALLKQVANGDIKPTSTAGTTSDSFTLTPSVSGWVYGPATVTVTDALPTFDGYVSYGTPSVSTDQPPAECVVDASSLLTCTYSLTATSSFSPGLGAITVPFSVSNDAPAGEFYNQAQVMVTQNGKSGTPENSNQVAVTVTPPAPVLGITKTASSPAAQPGGTDSFLLLPTVSGWVYHTVTISDPLPQPYMTSTGSPVLSGSSLPTGSTFTCSVVSETVTCTFTPSGGGVFSPNLGSVTVPVAFSGSTPAGVYTNTATVSDTGDGSTSMQSSATVTVSTPPAAPSVAPPTTPTPTSVAVPSTVPTGGHFGTRWFYFLIAVNGIAVLEISRRLLRRKRTA
ncbi:MAG: Ig-like domain repeat protein [Actinomycetota bacterium]|nr:Ig-like domain repeat protein [Actinomycetota bacterium]